MNSLRARLAAGCERFADVDGHQRGPIRKRRGDLFFVIRAYGDELLKMDNTICYLNTDLDLVCRRDLTELARALTAGGVRPLHVTKGADGRWYSTFETDEQHAEPAASISQMLSIVESLAEPIQSLWKHCTVREFNIGYDCGAEPWAFNQVLAADLLGRIAAVGASLRITLYPDRDEVRIDQIE